ncbi:hypothetical protein GQ55_3G071900 [Panicum hallii var. hallii]|uniref:Uncharacterized protein n=1 Tax=Panicum hallii var. hallii TaxID=1504633 RepID=A0A2T7E6N4_9POAL|nr:hypothetical protein GQ55_3G071900 [Panicum hallii var. hallii]
MVGSCKNRGYRCPSFIVIPTTDQFLLRDGAPRPQDGGSNHKPPRRMDDQDAPSTSR